MILEFLTNDLGTILDIIVMCLAAYLVWVSVIKSSNCHDERDFIGVVYWGFMMIFSAITIFAAGN